MTKLGMVVRVASAVLTLAGCGRGDGALDPAAVNEPYGGLTTTDEQPMFGEPEVFASLGMASADATVPDAIMTAPEYQQAEAAVTKIHYLLLGWGDLRATVVSGGTEDTAAQDFSGSFTLSDGAVGVLRKLRMEAVQGDGVLPRTDPKVVAWKSTIYDGVDGLLLRFAAPETATVTIAFDNGQTITKAVSDLDLAHGMIALPGSDDGIAWVAAALEKDPTQGCARGLLVGRWHPRKAVGGIFRGKWVSAEGELHGHLRGLYGERRNGDHVFFGKWIDPEGQFQGLLAGRYGDGELQGHWLDRGLALRGRIAGVYFEPTEISLHKVGFFAGTWHEACAADPLSPSEGEVQ